MMESRFAMFAVIAALFWAALAFLTVQAATALGLGAAGDFFFGDFAYPWRAQFNFDFAIHLLLVAAWMIWRAPNRIVGAVFGLLAINLGALFTLAFLMVAGWRARGDLRAVLLGRYA